MGRDGIERRRVARLASRARARENARHARGMLAHCRYCWHRCGADRRAGPAGVCRAGPRARVFSAQVEMGDEAELTPTFAIAFSGCDMRCDFCNTGRSSWDAREGTMLDIERLGERAREALGQGIRSVMFLGGEPSVHLGDALDLAGAMPDRVPLVWKTNAHASAEARTWLDGVFDFWVADYKFGNDACALRLSRTPDYTAAVRESLCWAAEHSELIVRHLLMPGHLECCFEPVARWVAERLGHVRFSLNAGYWPGWNSRRHPELNRTVTVEEAETARKRALDYGLRLGGEEDRGL